MDESTLSTMGKRVYDPIVIRKRIDRSSPLLAQALAHRQTVVATFRFYRPSPSGDGKEEHFYTIKIEGGYVASIATTSPDTLSPESAALPVTEEVQFNFSKITKTFTEGGLEFEDNWKATR